MYKNRVTDTAVYFLNGPFSQWFPSLFVGSLDDGGRPKEFNCTEQYMMASKALLMDDATTLDAIMDIVPREGNAALFEGLDAVGNPACNRAGKVFFNEEIPKRQKAQGRNVKPFDQDLWDTHCDAIVFRANYYKFTQNPHLQQFLLDTGDRHLVEGSRSDRIWGVGLDYADPRIEDQANWNGTNKLGQALMLVRQVIREHQALPHTPRRAFNPFTMTFE